MANQYTGKYIVDKNGRQCSTCKDYKTWDNFSSRKIGPFNKKSYCKLCSNNSKNPYYLIAEKATLYNATNASIISIPAKYWPFEIARFATLTVNKKQKTISITPNIYREKAFLAAIKNKQRVLFYLNKNIFSESLYSLDVKLQKSKVVIALPDYDDTLLASIAFWLEGTKKNFADLTIGINKHIYFQKTFWPNNGNFCLLRYSAENIFLTPLIRPGGKLSNNELKVLLSRRKYALSSPAFFSNYPSVKRGNYKLVKTLKDGTLQFRHIEQEITG